MHITISFKSLFIQGTDDPNRDWRGLMIPHGPSKQDSYELFVDGVSMKFSYAPNDIKVGTRTFHILSVSYEKSTAGGLWSLYRLRGLLL